MSSSSFNLWQAQELIQYCPELMCKPKLGCWISGRKHWGQLFLFLCLISSSPLLTLVASLISLLYSVLPAFLSLSQLILCHSCKLKGRVCVLARPEKYKEHRGAYEMRDTAKRRTTAGEELMRAARSVFQSADSLSLAYMLIYTFMQWKGK